MTKPLKIQSTKQSISRVIWNWVGIPMSLIIMLFTAWLCVGAFENYTQERNALVDQNLINSNTDTAGNLKNLHASDPGYALLDDLRHELYTELMIVATIGFLGVIVPIIASKYLADSLVRNLNRLKSTLSLEASSNQEQGYDFIEFEKMNSMIGIILSKSSETQRRWSIAKNQLSSANKDLIDQANELKQGRKIALSMMEDAEKARSQLEVANSRLKQVIEHARQSARDADHANHAKSDFMATMSHEIRTPLNGVIGFIDMLAETPLNAEQRDFVDTLQVSSEALLFLISDILDFSKIESGRLDLDMHALNLNDLLHETLRLFQAEAASKKIDLLHEFDDALPEVIIGDEKRIRQILINLLGNAFKFTNKGSVVLKASVRDNEKQSSQSHLEFEIRDTGIGIDSNELDTIFEPFSQADSSTTRRFGGTGLGLSISRRLASAMNGQLSVKSQLGSGSSFFFDVIVNIHREKVLSSEASSESNLSLTKNDGTVYSPDDSLKLKVLVAEDNLANQHLLRYMLKRMGCVAQFCNNGKELISLLSEQSSDLILMDLQMPLMDGFEATHAIRNGEAGNKAKSIKIIALTANALSGDRDRCLDAGMDAYLSKPIKISILKKCIAALFDEVT
ncbi:MAG: ATP-binding protein [Verrucomicrobiota bacterium]|nr:ATP-binding protein [Verrucomicrobiota bacterium]